MAEKWKAFPTIAEGKALGVGESDAWAQPTTSNRISSDQPDWAGSSARRSGRGAKSQFKEGSDATNGKLKRVLWLRMRGND